jgi:hypothetical protein
MSEIPDLWPEIVEAELTTPASILKAQGANLGQKTNHLLEGETSTRNISGDFEHTFYIYAPTLDYRLQVMEVRHDLKFYPLLASAWGGIYVTIENEEKFLAWIKDVFSQTRTKQAIQSLLAQIKSA